MNPWLVTPPPQPRGGCMAACGDELGRSGLRAPRHSPPCACVPVGGEHAQEKRGMHGGAADKWRWAEPRLRELLALASKFDIAGARRACWNTSIHKLSIEC
jgi:hypothetical protein